MTWIWQVDRTEPKARRQQVRGDKLEGGDERYERGDEGDEEPPPTSHKQINEWLSISAAEKPKIRYPPSDDYSPHTELPLPPEFQHFIIFAIGKRKNDRQRRTCPVEIEKYEIYDQTAAPAPSSSSSSTSSPTVFFTSFTAFCSPSMKNTRSPPVELYPQMLLSFSHISLTKVNKFCVCNCRPPTKYDVVAAPLPHHGGCVTVFHSSAKKTEH